MRKPANGYRFPWETMKRDYIDKDLLIYGPDENRIVRDQGLFEGLSGFPPQRYRFGRPLGDLRSECPFWQGSGRLRQSEAAAIAQEIDRL